MDAKTLQMVLANRDFTLQLAARAYACEPDEAFRNVLLSQHARDELGLVDDARTGRILDLLDQARAYLAQPDSLAAVRREYTRTFVGPGILKADPFETVQLTGKRVLFQPGVLDVRAAYREAGLEPAASGRVADDFIGLELDFMAKLAERAVSANDGGDEEALDRALDQSGRFLDGHLLRWLPRCADAMAAAYGACFYTSFTQITALMLQRDRDVLRELQAR